MREMLPRIQRICAVGLLVLLAVPALSQKPSEQEATKLLDHLAGHWVMTGTLGGKPATHDLEAEWVLNREYLRLHETGREKMANGSPYEAIIFLAWDNKAGEYRCLWLDDTEGGGLSVPIAPGKKAGESIALVFRLGGKEAIHTSFSYEGKNDSWRLTIDDVTGAKPQRFGDMRLVRVK